MPAGIAEHFLLAVILFFLHFILTIPVATILIREHLSQLASLIYPAVCVGCETVLASESESKLVDQEFQSSWCDDCWVRLPESWQRGCPKCGSYVRRPSEFEDRCALCRDISLRFDSTVALGNYHGMLKRLVLELKRDMNEPLAFQLGRLLGFRLMHYDLVNQIDFLVPVPIHWSRRFRRGFHAAGVIAEGVRKATKLPIQSGMIKCQRLTRKQGTLTGLKRFQNVKDAFILRPLTTVRGSTILVIDDVMTSGATLSELAKMLKKNGAAAVHGAVVARGTGNFKPSV